MVQAEWGADLIASWNKHDWLRLPLRVGAKLAGLIGAHASEVLVADTTSLNLFKAAAAALQLRPDRRLIVTGAPAPAARGRAPQAVPSPAGLCGATALRPATACPGAPARAAPARACP